MILCERCIDMLRSRGETVIVGYEIEKDTEEFCYWCEDEETELFEVMLNPFGRDCGGAGL